MKRILQNLAVIGVTITILSLSSPASGLAQNPVTPPTSFSPAGSSIGCESYSALNLSDAHSLSIQIGGHARAKQSQANRCAAYDTVLITEGDLKLNDAHLNLDFRNGHLPEVGRSYFIIVNQGAGEVIGQFKGLPDGGNYNFPGITFKITYNFQWNDLKGTILTVSDVDPSLIKDESFSPAGDNVGCDTADSVSLRRDAIYLVDFEGHARAKQSQSDRCAVYDATIATGGNVTIDDTRLNVRLGDGHVPSVGRSYFILVTQAASAAVTGSFAGLPEGSTFSQDGITYQVNYNTRWGDLSGTTLTVTAANFTPGKGTDYSPKLNQVGCETHADFQMNAGSRYQVDIAGHVRARDSQSARCDVYDATIVTEGDFVINSAKLSPELNSGYSPEEGRSFFIIVTRGSHSKVVGQFAGLPDGATFTRGRVTYKISYNTNWNGLRGTTLFVQNVAPETVDFRHIFSPADNAQGCTEVKNVTLHDSSTYRVDIAGHARAKQSQADRCDAYDTVIATESDVIIGNAKLNVNTLGRYVPTVGQSYFIILTQEPNAKVVGQFSGLPDGATFVTHGVTYKITYNFKWGSLSGTTLRVVNVESPVNEASDIGLENCSQIQGSKSFHSYLDEVVDPYLIIPSDWQIETAESNSVEWYTDFVQNRLVQFFQSRTCHYLHILDVKVVFSDRPGGWFWCREQRYIDQGCAIDNFHANSIAELPPLKHDRSGYLIANMGGGGYAGTSDHAAINGNITLASTGTCDYFVRHVIEDDFAPGYCRDSWTQGGAQGAIMHEIGHLFGLSGHNDGFEGRPDETNISFMSGHWHFPEVGLADYEIEKLKTNRFFN